ncbi:MAG: hypothetical protein ACI4CE_07360 [Methanomethylophilus alvi]
MSKAYIITIVDHGDSCDGKARVIGVYFDREKALRELRADIDYYKEMNSTYTEGDLSVMDDDGNGCEWNMEERDIFIPLTPFQVTNLNLLAMQIAKGEEDFSSYEDIMSDEETDYLITTLEQTYKVFVLPDGSVAHGQEEREKWIAEHGEEGK